MRLYRLTFKKYVLSHYTNIIGVITNLTFYAQPFRGATNMH